MQPSVTNLAHYQLSHNASLSCVVCSKDSTVTQNENFYVKCKQLPSLLETNAALDLNCPVNSCPAEPRFVSFLITL